MKNIVFCGFGKLGKDCLVELIRKDFVPSLILTHKELLDESVDTFAINNNLKYSYKDSRKNISEMKKVLMAINPYCLISVNYRYIIPKDIFRIPEYAVNIHGSLLPKYRGRTPHVWSIINGEDYSGITVHLIEEIVDTGDIINQISVKIDEDDTGYTLLKKYEKLYPRFLIDSLLRLEENIPLIKQDERYANFYGKRIPEMGYIDFNKNAKDIINFIRAQANPYPGAYYYLKNGRKVIINQVVYDKLSNGENLQIGVIELIKDNYYIKCKDAILKLKDFNVVSL